jgi:hypothetical protein
MAEPSAKIADRTKAPKGGAKGKQAKAGNTDNKGKQAKAGNTENKGKQTKAGNADTKGISVTRAEDLGLWYSEVLTKAGIVSYYDVQDMYHFSFALAVN